MILHSDSDISLCRVLIHVHGIVQGVGFRPYVFQLARLHELNGTVRNRSNGVEIEISGSSQAVDAFIQDLPLKAPPLARIVRIEVQQMPFLPFDSFRIERSVADQSRKTLIAPDVCTCSDCLRELFDPNDRRFRYPFINCTNCGPRYTIIRDIPYDRKNTTMASFTMCDRCLAEYEDPGNRRFHAQPNACWECGPQVWLESASGNTIAHGDQAVRELVGLLSDGAIAAIKGLGGFHLAVSATDETAVDRLRSRKVREEKPFAVMFPDLDTVKSFCLVNELEAAHITSPERPIVLLRRTFASRAPDMASGVAPNNRFLGAFLPYSPLHYLLFCGSPYQALVLTSGNRSDEPIVTKNEEAKERLSEIADFFLFHDRDIYMRCDDSVTRVLHHKPRPVRRARGYVPVPVFMKEEGPSVLGVGAELKNTVCLTRGEEAFVSQHIGDLENLETLRSFELSIAHLQKILEIQPRCISHDMHPDYLSTQWTLTRHDVPRLAVQHHHAHIASVVAEQHISGPVLGLAMDGTGYGPDGTIWGGEVLLVEDYRFKRLGHFVHLPMPGGAQAIKEPWRMGLSVLWKLDPDHFREKYSDFLRRWPKEKIPVITQMLRQNINRPLTSSCGRLFDAVSSLLGLRNRISYEGQAAIELEQTILDDDTAYPGRIYKDGGLWIMDSLTMIPSLLEDVGTGVGAGIIAARFHNGIVSLLSDAAELIAREMNLDQVALSGGVFQNAYLLERLEPELRKRGLRVFTHVHLPSNDACIALGQAYVAIQWMKKGCPDFSPEF